MTRRIEYKSPSKMGDEHASRLESIAMYRAKLSCNVHFDACCREAVFYSILLILFCFALLHVDGLCIHPRKIALNTTVPGSTERMPLDKYFMPSVVGRNDEVSLTEYSD
jgi:hypothetical protein